MCIWLRQVPQPQLALFTLDGKPAQLRFAHTGWDTCPALLTPLALLALKVVLNVS